MEMSVLGGVCFSLRGFGIQRVGLFIAVVGEQGKMDRWGLELDVSFAIPTIDRS